MPNPNITVSSTAVRVVIADTPAPLVNPPVGTYTIPSLTIDQYGRVTAANQNSDIATDLTQDLLEQTTESLTAILTGGITTGTWTQP